MELDELFEGRDERIAREMRAALKRASATINNTLHHKLIHTSSPDTTLHHAVVAACPNPDIKLAELGAFYMVCYVSVPLEWLPVIESSAQTWDVSFIGPAGLRQRLPTSLLEFDDIIGSRIYVGFDWLWAKEGQPTESKLFSNLTIYVTEMRKLFMAEGKA